MLRRLLPFTTALLIVALGYTAWVYYGRRSREREQQQRMELQKQEEARKTLQMLGGDRLKILTLTLDPAIMGPGEKSELCYGVANAVSVKIDPPVGEVAPAYTRCLSVMPRHDTTYTLTARDAAGHEETAKLTLYVRK